MNTTISCTIAGENVVITNNAVRCASSSLQIELVKRLIECKSKVHYKESALPLFYNKYLRHYPITDVKFITSENTGYAMAENWEQRAAA